MTETEAEQRAAVVAEALSWRGTPYHHMGRLKGVGVDCAMLPAEVYAVCGLIPRQAVPFYPRDWHLHRSGERYLERVLSHARPLPEDAAPQPGDLALWRFGRCFAHGAIVIAWPRVLHACQGRPVAETDALADADLARRDRRLFTLWGQ